MKNIIVLFTLIFSVSAFSSATFQGQDQNGNVCSLTLIKKEEGMMVRVKGEELSTLFMLVQLSDTEYLYESFLPEEEGKKGISLYVNFDPEQFEYYYYSKFDTERTIQCKLRD